MTQSLLRLLPFDAVRYLTDEAAITEYMAAVLEQNDPELRLLALSDITRARHGVNGDSMQC